MISADHPRFSCTSDLSLTIYGNIFSGPLVHTNDPSETGVYLHVEYVFATESFSQHYSIHAIFFFLILAC